MTISNAVIDISHFNQHLDFAAIRRSGIIGVIHKASQGLLFQDPAYKTHRAAAKRAGLLWGAYHFGTGADGVGQADAFLNFVKPTSQTLVVLDFETNPVGASMTLPGAREFVAR